MTNNFILRDLFCQSENKLIKTKKTKNKKNQRQQYFDPHESMTLFLKEQILPVREQSSLHNVEINEQLGVLIIHPMYHIVVTYTKQMNKDEILHIQKLMDLTAVHVQKKSVNHPLLSNFKDCRLYFGKTIWQCVNYMMYNGKVNDDMFVGLFCLEFFIVNTVKGGSIAFFQLKNIQHDIVHALEDPKLAKVVPPNLFVAQILSLCDQIVTPKLRPFHFYMTIMYIICCVIVYLQFLCCDCCVVVLSCLIVCVRVLQIHLCHAFIF